MILKALEAAGLIAAMTLALPDSMVTHVGHAVAYLVLVSSMATVAFRVRPQQPTTRPVWMVGAVAIAARAYAGGTTLDPRFLACVSLALAFAMTLFSAEGEGGTSTTLPQRVMHRFFYVATAVSMLFGGNQILDFRDVDQEITSVAGGRMLRGGTPFAQYLLTLKSWNPSDPWLDREFQVSREAHASLATGDSVDVDVHRGAFGSSWVGQVKRSPDEP